MIVKLLRFFVAILVLSAAFPLSAQQTPGKTASAIDILIETHPFKAAIFRLRPLFSAGSAYDSNAYSTAESEIEDYYTAISPGISAALKFGRRGYLVVQEDLNFVAYSNQDVLNDVYNTTSGRIGFGGNRVLVEATGRLLKREARIDEEFDQPANQDITSVGSSILFGATRTSDFVVSFAEDRFRYSLISEADTELPLPPDADVSEFRFQWLQSMGKEFQITAEFASVDTTFINRLDFTDADSWRTLAGLRFTGVRLAGHASAGYGQTTTATQIENKSKDFLIDADVFYRPGNRLSIGFYARRIRTISALSQDGFRLLTEAGPKVCVPLSRNLFADGSLLFGSNSYRDDLQNSLSNDQFRRLDAGINIGLPYNLIVRGGATYQTRDSSDPERDKSRFTLNVGIALDLRRSSTEADPGICSPVSVPN